MCNCAEMAPDRKPAWLPWLRMTAPALFVGYGLYLVAHSVFLAALVGAGVLLLCRFLLDT
jgi:cytochrome c biogenesis factor